MKVYSWLVSIVVLVVLAGCEVTSFHPLYTEKDLVFDPALVGTWSEKNSKNSNYMWIFTKGKGKEYNFVAVNDSGEREKYIVHLVKVKGRLFLDIFPECPKDYCQPLHTFMRVDQVEPTLQIAILNYDWMEEFLHLHPDAVRHVKEDTDLYPDMILTAKPKELQAFLLKHEKDAFEGPIQMVKKYKNIYLLRQPK